MMLTFYELNLFHGRHIAMSELSFLRRRESTTNEGEMNKSAGFTLIELIVVITLIAILLGVVVYSGGSINNQSRQLEQEARRFLLVWQYLQDEVDISGKPFGIQVFENGYQILKWQSPQSQDLAPTKELASNSAISLQSKTHPQWQLVSDDTILKRHLLSENFFLELSVTYQKVPLDQLKITDSDNFLPGRKIAQQLQPNLILLPGGDKVVFSLMFQLLNGSTSGYEITLDDLGRSSLTRLDQSE